MYYYRVGISAEEHDRFVRRSSLVNLLQSSAWASVKSEWENERVGFYSDNQIVAVASLLWFYNVLHCQRSNFGLY